MHHSPWAGSLCLAFSTLSVIIWVRRASLIWLSHPVVTAFALHYIMPTAMWSQSHTGRCPTSFPYRGKKQSALWELQEYLKPHFSISIAGCLPPYWGSGLVCELRLQATLDPCNPGQTVPISLRCAMLGWRLCWYKCHWGTRRWFFYCLLLGQHSTNDGLCYLCQNPVWSDSTFCYETPLSEMAIKFCQPAPADRPSLNPAMTLFDPFWHHTCNLLAHTSASAM